MADYESALSEVSVAFAADESGLAGRLAEILTDAIQALIEDELTAKIGAASGERSVARTVQRNGHRPKLVSTPGGDITVAIPKVRKGSFFPELLEPRRRIDKALWAVIMTAYITGTSTRKVDDLVKALGCDSGVSKSSVSRICAGIDADVKVLRERRLDHQPFIYLWLDATYVHVRENHQVISKAIDDRGVGEQLLHGEPHPGNVLSTKDGPLFVDLETCCRGPAEFDLAHVPESVSGRYPGVDQELLGVCQQLVLAMVAAWRWDRHDQFPNGKRAGEGFLQALRDGPPWPTLDVMAGRLGGR